VNTVVPSALHAEQSTGCSCAVAALATAWPLADTSQQRTWLSHDVATRWLATGLNDRLLMPSLGGCGTSKSLLGLCAPPLAANAAPKLAIYGRSSCEGCARWARSLDIPIGAHVRSKPRIG